MQITAIKTDNNGYKLIAFRKELYRRKAKPYYSVDSLADYKDNTLTVYNWNQSRPVKVNGYKAALKYILSL